MTSLLDAAIAVAARGVGGGPRRRAAVGEGRHAVGGIRQAAGRGGRLARLAGSAGRDGGPRRRARAPGARRPRRRLPARRRARHGRLEPGARALQPRLRPWRLGRRPRAARSSTRPTRTRCAASASWAQPAADAVLRQLKSGSTTEPNAFQAAMGEIAPALDFVAITDPGTALAELARAQEFRAIVEAPPDVGGRYSALTVFGLVPAALHGVDLGGLLERAARAWPMRAGAAEAADNPGLALGAAHRRGRAGGARQADDPHLAAPGGLRRLGRAARRREHRQGGHGASSPSSASRCATPMRTRTIGTSSSSAGNDPHDDLRGAARPTLSSGWPSGASTSAWPIRSTSAPSSCAGRSRPRRRGSSWDRPFDQPNVQECKDATTALLEAFRTDRGAAEPMPLVAEPRRGGHGGPAALGDTPVTVDGAVAQLLASSAAGIDYVALLAYLPHGRRRRGAAPARSGARSGRRPARRRRSASARASSTRPASSTRADRTTASSFSSPPIRRRTCRSPAGTSRSARSSRPRHSATSPPSRSAARRAIRLHFATWRPGWPGSRRWSARRYRSRRGSRAVN